MLGLGISPPSAGGNAAGAEEHAAGVAVGFVGDAAGNVAEDDAAGEVAEEVVEDDVAGESAGESCEDVGATRTNRISLHVGFGHSTCAVS